MKRHIKMCPQKTDRFEREILEALFIQQLRPSLNKQDMSVPLELLD